MTGETMRASDQVRAQVEAEIASGALRPGDSIDERSLSERFDVSRTPAREAIMQLAASGLVRISRRRGAVIAGASAEEAVAVMETLAALEAEAAALACRRIDAEERASLRAIHVESRAAAEAGDGAAYVEHNARFHGCLYAAARNPYLADLLRKTRLRMAFYHSSSLRQSDRALRSREEHGAVIAAIEAGDPDRAAAAMREHIVAGGRVYADLVAALPGAWRARAAAQDG